LNFISGTTDRPTASPKPRTHPLLEPEPDSDPDTYLRT
jgi:hypothetical protein